MLFNDLYILTQLVLSFIESAGVAPQEPRRRLAAGAGGDARAGRGAAAKHG